MHNNVVHGNQLRSRTTECIDPIKSFQVDKLARI